MKIGGLQKTSLLDYPNHISAIIWTMGCNFRCSYCYNKQLVYENLPIIPENEILSFLEKRKKLLEGVVITGGEPILQEDLTDFIRKVKSIGYKVKLDTNGSNPKKILSLLDEKLVDYVAMDIKAPKEKYDSICNVKVNISDIDESIRIIRTYASNYEFKTTFVPTLLEKSDIIEICKWLKGSKQYCIQQFQCFSEMISKHLTIVKPYPKEFLYETLNDIKHLFEHAVVRGV